MRLDLNAREILKCLSKIPWHSLMPLRDRSVRNGPPYMHRAATATTVIGPVPELNLNALPNL